MREVLARGDGGITGGATGVDYFVMDEAMKIDATAARLLVIIPQNSKAISTTTIPLVSEHYQRQRQYSCRVVKR